MRNFLVISMFFLAGNAIAAEDVAVVDDAAKQAQIINPSKLQFSAKITSEEARIAAVKAVAEKITPIKAALMLEEGKVWQYQVDVELDGQVWVVTVDANTGAVVSATLN